MDIIHFHFPSSLRRTEISLIVPQQHQLLRIFSQTKLQVATCKGLGVFWKLLFRWKGSIYKLVRYRRISIGAHFASQVWHNLLLYLIVYYILSLTYRLILNENGRVS